jgi:hypothetical protein
MPEAKAPILSFLGTAPWLAMLVNDRCKIPMMEVLIMHMIQGITEHPEDVDQVSRM